MRAFEGGSEENGVWPPVYSYRYGPIIFWRARAHTRRPYRCAPIESEVEIRPGTSPSVCNNKEEKKKRWKGEKKKRTRVVSPRGNRKLFLAVFLVNATETELPGMRTKR